ncbi:MAG: TonB family protein [Gemmatimonadetes bacterium]|nr:TonB family protein [Gemmatimonadota bacterium]NIO31640.1 TonB family protein [Gemmatimonadota bacterium]
MAVFQGKQRGALSATHRETANDRFKERCNACLWGSVILATVFHFGVIRFFPTLTAADVAFGVTEFEAIELPPEIEIPPPPEQIPRPAVPVVATTELEEDITIAPTTFEENPLESLPPPPDQVERLMDRPVFTPYTVAPRLVDPERARRIVSQKYPPIMKQAGISGTTRLLAFIDAEGVVRRCVVGESSGYDELDRAALEAMMEFEFEPAIHMDQHVPVWIAMPIIFTLTDPGF